MHALGKNWIWLTAALLLTTVESDAARRTAAPAEVKSAYIAALSRYTEWPKSAFKDASSPIQVTVLGKDSLGSWLDRTVKGKTARGRKFNIRRITDLKDLTPSHVLFLGEDVADAPNLLKKLADKPILIVSEASRFLEEGGAVQFLPSRPFVTFGVNLDAIQKAGLKINSKVLDSARKIIRNGRARTR